MPIDLLPDATQLPAMVTEHMLGEDFLRQRGAVLTGEALADWSLLTPSGRGISLSGLPGTLVMLNGLRLTPAANGQVDMSLIPLAWLGSAELMAGPAGMAQGAGSIGGALTLALADVGAGNRAWAVAGSQAGRGIGGLDVRVGDDLGWVSAGFTQGGALATPAGLAGTRQGRWHVAGRFAQDIGGGMLTGRGLLASRRDGDAQADYHDLALELRGGRDWQWSLTAATGAHQDGSAGSRQTLFAANIARRTSMILSGAVDPITLAFGAEQRRLRLAATRVVARELHAEAYMPLLQDRPAAEDLGLELGWRQAWIAGRSEPLWKVRARWEFFPGVALRGQLARGIDGLATTSGIGRSIGLRLAPAFVSGLVASVDWRSQTAGPARVRAIDAAGFWRGRIGGTAQLTLEALFTHHLRADLTPLPVARFQSLLRARVETGGLAALAGWRQRSSLAGVAARGGLDLAIERQLSERIRLIASVSNAADTGRADGPLGRQALLQLVAGF